MILVKGAESQNDCCLHKRLGKAGRHFRKSGDLIFWSIGVNFRYPNRLSEKNVSRNCCQIYLILGFPVAQTVKNLPAMQEMQETGVQSLGGEYCLEKEKATHSSILAWEIPWTEEPGGLWSVGS